MILPWLRLRLPTSHAERVLFDLLILVLVLVAFSALPALTVAGGSNPAARRPGLRLALAVDSNQPMGVDSSLPPPGWLDQKRKSRASLSRARREAYRRGR